jgi:hypothetical protein
VATTTWPDEPAPAYAARGGAARARRGRIGGFSETNFISLTIRSRGNARQ